MRCLVFSDIHGNLDALEAVLTDAGHVDQIWSLGDVVGYGPQPNECIARLRETTHIAVAGNHDWAAVGKLETTAFNQDALRACLWTRNVLSPSSSDYILALPETVVEDDYTLAHGSPRYPIWEYITDTSVAAASLAHFATPYCLVGHTHVPRVFHCKDLGPCAQLDLPLGEVMRLGRERTFINPGGVGQPRDGDPRASYLLLDSAENTVELRRVEYDVEHTQSLMRSARLPERLIWRLAQGW